MPIYSYRCEDCEHAQDVLQKISDLPLAVCPSCGASAFRKQVTAAGFQLKGSGWYVTDFRNPPAAKTGTTSKADNEAGAPSAAASDDKSAPAIDSGAREKAASAPASDAPSTSGDKGAAKPPKGNTPSATAAT